MIKKIFKFIFTTLVVVTILAAGSLFTLYKMYPPEKLKNMVQEYVAKNFQRELVFDKISFTWIGFTLTNVALSENSTLADGTFIKARQLTAHVAVKPLLKKRIEISTLEADGLQIQIIQHKDGSFNFDTLLSPQQGNDTTQDNTSTTAKTTENPLVLTAQTVALKNCNISYQNQQSGMDVDVEDINIQITDFDLSAPFNVDIAFTTELSMLAMPHVTVPVHISLRTFLAGLDMPNAKLTLTDATANYQTVKLNLKGEIADFANPSVNLSGSLAGITNKVLADFAPDLPNFTLPTVNMTLQAQADLDKSMATISQAKLSVQDSVLNTQGTLGWEGTTPTYNLATSLKADLEQLVQMTDTLDGFNPGGQISGNFKLTEKKNNKDVTGRVTLKNISALYEPFVLTQTNGTVNITSLDDISSSGITGKLNGENFKTVFSYKNVRDVINLVFNLDMDKLVLKTLPGTSDSTPQSTSTQTQANPAEDSAVQPFRMNLQTNINVGGIEVPYFTAGGLTLNAQLTDITPTMSQTNGTLAFALKPGKITNLDTFIKDSKIAKIILLPVAIVKKVAGFLGLKLFAEDADGTSISFTQGAGQYTFTNGVMNLDKTVFNSTVTNISASGTADFNTESLNMKATATLFTQAAPVVIKITGTMSEPKGKLDVVNTVTSVVGNILNGTTVKSAAKTGAGATQQTTKLATDAVKGTVNTATDLVKGIGGLLKKKADK